jgi:hypothetical protein
MQSCYVIDVGPSMAAARPRGLSFLDTSLHSVTLSVQSAMHNGKKDEAAVIFVGSDGSAVFFTHVSLLS